MSNSKNVDDRVYSGSKDVAQFRKMNNVSEFKETQSAIERWSAPEIYNPIAAKTFSSLIEACRYLKQAIQYWLTNSPNIQANTIMNLPNLPSSSISSKKTRSQFAKHLNLAVIFDLDETVLHYFGDGMHDCNIPKCVRTLLVFLRENNVKVCFITARRESMRTETLETLASKGVLEESDLLFMKPNDFPKHRSSVFKSRMRKQIQNNGYFILANVGDQFSDLIPVHYWKRMIERMQRDLPESHILQQILQSLPQKMNTKEKLKKMASNVQNPVLFYLLEKNVPFALKLPQQDFFTV
jgi:hypothetical protein